MASCYVVKMAEEKVLHFGLENQFFAMQQQYDKETTQTVTTLWNMVLGIQKGDWLIACQAGVTAFAIGKVREPRLPCIHKDSIGRTTKNKKHIYSDGIVCYTDCSFFYENFDDPIYDYNPYAQRIDVEEWLFMSEDGVHVSNILENVVNGMANGTIYQITQQLFETIKSELKGAFMKSPQHIHLQALRFNRQIILQGPPGTSKTWTAKELTAKLLRTPKNLLETKRFSKKSGKGSWALVQFHPSYNYEDFVRGIQVTTTGKSGVSAVSYDTVNRIFGEMAEEAEQRVQETREAQGAEEAKKNDVPPYVLIIDEINRANLAAVLGELIYALEYRGEEVDTPYEVGGSNSLKVPKNLYIIGTMNTADRSVGHIDYAVRRRFVFVSLLPDKNVLNKYYQTNLNAGVGIQDLAIVLFEAVEKLFKSGGYLAPDFFGDDVQVGHTYFMAKDCEELAMKFAYQVYPLLREYFKDGILIPKGKGTIEIEIDLTKIPPNVGKIAYKIHQPEKSSYIYDQIKKLC